MPRTRIRETNIEDIVIVTEAEFNEFFETVVITGTPDATEVVQSFADFFPGQGLIQGGGDLTVITGSNFVTISGGTSLSETFVASGSVSQFDYVYLSSVDNQVSPAKADSASTIEVIGMATEAAATGESLNVKLKGIVEGAAAGLTAGSPLFLAASTAGDFTDTPPTAVDTYILQVGLAVNSTDVYVNVNSATATKNIGGTGFDLQSAYGNGDGIIQLTPGTPVVISGTEDDAEEDFKVIGSGTFTEALTIGTGTTYLSPEGVTAASGTFSNVTVSGVPVTTGAAGGSQYIHMRHETTDAAGGTFSSGAWRTRPLNTIVTDETGEVTLVSNQFTLPAGTYRVYATLPVYIVGRHTGKLENTTDGAMVLQGIPAFAHNTLGGRGRSNIHGKFTISASKTFELQHRCDVTKAEDGFGTADVSGQGGSPLINIYASIELWKVA